MVVLASSVCTKSGKAVISRQYVEMSRPRIEGLLASFPKLISAGGQHTYVETEAVRYIYQPLEDLYLVLITNKQSNILQDINTLHVFARTVSEYCRSLKEHEISRNAYELICAFDEIVSLGTVDCVNVGQIRTFTEMDSHEEKLQEMLQKSKEREALEKAKLKAKQLEMQKREMQKRGLSNTGFGGSGMGSAGSMGRSSFTGASSVTSPPSNLQSSSYGAEPVQSKSNIPPGGASRKGMQLGTSKPNKASGMLEAIRADEGIPDSSVEDPLILQNSAVSGLPAATGSSSVVVSTTVSPRAAQGPVHLIMDEKISASMNRDGGLENMEVKGELTLRISAADKARLKVGMKVIDVDSNIQFKTHPHVDKNMWQTDWTIATKDPSKPFPLNQPTPVVKWRYVTKDESMVPLSVNVWPTPSGSGNVDCSVEYELMSDKSELRDVCIHIPLPAGSGQPKVDHVDGEYRINGAQKIFEWHIPIIDSSSSSGTLEFSVSGNENSSFFPVKVTFNSKKTFCDIEIARVVSAENDSPIDFTRESMLSTDEYQII